MRAWWGLGVYGVLFPGDGGTGALKMIIIKWLLETGMVGCDREGEVELDDDATEEDIENAVREDMWNYLSLTWEKVKPDGEETEAVRN